MILRDLLGDSARIKILEELISNWDYFLSVEEIARMSDVSKKSVYIHIKELNNIGILSVDEEGSKKFKLNPNDKRAIALALIESDEFLRKLDEFELNIDSTKESLPLSVSSMENYDLLNVNSQRTNDAMKSISLITLIM
ncbi:winged helix-turn-helix domain-containing protein [Methanobrevibacter millerae]|uniref:HTH domain-containing protein n=1 Tax=Methanobrevibacter millerae TaxID=230361 RepID=A0A1G5WQA5_9EURY|nr:winged helix-turn-helix domain-containing protein [Methanobrevibacter millerae]SDA59435.1 HTH domain-containing protein [Methanobrevibacter millerae]